MDITGSLEVMWDEQVGSSFKIACRNYYHDFADRATADTRYESCRLSFLVISEAACNSIMRGREDTITRLDVSLSSSPMDVRGYVHVTTGNCDTFSLDVLISCPDNKEHMIRAVNIRKGHGYGRQYLASSSISEMKEWF